MDTEIFSDLPKVTQPVGGVVEPPESEPNSLVQELKLFTPTSYYFLEVLNSSLKKYSNILVPHKSATFATQPTGISSALGINRQVSGCSRVSLKFCPKLLPMGFYPTPLERDSH